MDVISKIVEPTIATKDISLLDKTSVEGYQNDIGLKKIGLSSPYIVINDMQFWDGGIIDFTLDTSGFLPKVSCIIADVNQRLTNDFMPLDDILCLYIKSDNTDFSDIRQDFRINSFTKVTHGKFAIEATLEVPKIYVDKIKGWQGTTFSCLKEIAQELGLGVASNISDTNDTMYHLCTNTSYYDFIQNELLGYIYNDENSFFTCFIDQYYYLNIIELNSLVKTEVNAEIYSEVTILEEELHSDKERFESEMFVSNHPEKNGTASYIRNYVPINNSGRVAKKKGYRQNVMFYDKDNKEEKQFFVESLTTDGITEEDRVLKGENEEDHTVNTRNEYHGSFFLDNSHENYYFARTFNDLNNKELSKINVEIELAGVNFGLTNYLILPVHIINVDQSYIDLQKESDVATNFTLSGNHLVTGLRYIYNNQERITRMKFIGKKREFKKFNREE